MFLPHPQVKSLLHNLIEPAILKCLQTKGHQGVGQNITSRSYRSGDVPQGRVHRRPALLP